MCFHESTVITYHGNPVSLVSPAPCVVPHVLDDVSDGIIIEIISPNGRYHSPLRVTGAHLLFTQRGLVRADELKEDVLFADIEGTVKLEIASVTREAKPQRYFGLNCPDGSAVLANGIKASTFDTYHRVPAAWMRSMSALFGIERASRWGDILAGWGAKLGIV